MAAPSKGCSLCQKTSSAVWRIDKEAKDTVCNPCYLKKYPRQPKRATEATEANGESTKKRRKKLELEAVDDPIAALAKEHTQRVGEMSSTDNCPLHDLHLKRACKQSVDPNDLCPHFKDAPEKEKKDKKDKKDEKSKKDKKAGEVKKEEVKQEIIKKEEDKEDIEVEIKEEPDNAIDGLAMDGLDDIFGAATERKKKEHKHSSSRDSVMNQVNGEPPVLEDIVSDTEYEEVTYDDKSVGQATIIIEASSSSKLDGKYDRLPKSSRGRQAYFMRKGDKLMYLYWQKQWWKLGSEFGSSKSNAKVKDVEGLMDCLEPYAHSWQVFAKETTQKFEAVPAMRVYDAETASMQVQLPEPLMEANAGIHAKISANATPEDVAAMEQRKKEKEEKKKNKLEKKEAKIEEAAIAEANGTVVVKEESAANDDANEKAEDAPPSDSSSSSSQQSQSSSDDEDEAEQATAQALVCACGRTNEVSATFCQGCGQKLVQDKEDIAKQAQDKKASEFEAKLISELQKIAEPTARNKKLEQIKKMLEDRKAGLQKAAGMDEERIGKLVAMLERDFFTAQTKKSPKAPTAPPPKHLLKKEAQPSGDGEDGSRLNTAMPSTPPENATGDDTGSGHRHLGQPAKSALKRRGAPRNHSRRIQYNAVLLTENAVLSYRSETDLWFQMPGSTVVCDHCDRSVSQGQGSLQGAAGRSQFAQLEFLCMDCANGQSIQQ